jgi:hypothetical protein
MVVAARTADVTGTVVGPSVMVTALRMRSIRPSPGCSTGATHGEVLHLGIGEHLVHVRIPTGP